MILSDHGSEDIDCDDDNALEAAANPQSVTVEPRMRGRPRKNPLHDPAAPRRPRGRPRKEGGSRSTSSAAISRQRSHPRREETSRSASSASRPGRPPNPRRPVGRPRRDPSNNPLCNFDDLPPRFTGDEQESPLSARDTAISQQFHAELAKEKMQFCFRCKERWFDVELKQDGVCKRCHNKDDKRQPNEPFFYSADNSLDFGEIPEDLPTLLPAEEMIVARVHVSVNIFTVSWRFFPLYSAHL